MTKEQKEYEIDKIKARMCDDYCNRPFQAADQVELDEFCKYCPLNELGVIVNDG